MKSTDNKKAQHLQAEGFIEVITERYVQYEYTISI
ncbi:hypothetical protein F909_04106 [Acinetobacter sp. ANC 3929]|nr:hypothetical protein F909_04106 [Acinetobacter sp. ANC 3929]ENX48643.1 hypothetical protein F943_02176 [Acinetobacter ursingii NIPH 706]